MDNKNFIDLSKLPISPNAEINSLVAIDKDGNVIVAQNNGGVTPNELNEILSNYPTDEALSETLSNYVTDDELLVQDFVTNEELNNKGYLTEVPSEYVTESELNTALEDYQPKGEYLTEVPSDYVTESELNTALAPYALASSVPTKVSQLENDSQYLTSIPSEYVTTAVTNNLQEQINDIQTGGADLTNYYTKEECNDTFQPKGSYLTEVPSEYITESELNSTLEDYQPKGDYLTSIPSEYVTESELTSKDYATKGELQTVQNLIPSIVSLTQTEYDALTIKDNNTLYLIIG